MKRLLAAVAWVAAVASFPPPAAALESEAGGQDLSKNVRLLDVPYVPQGDGLCGGAALAMVLRYWGEPAVLAEDFTPLLEPGSAGIRTDVLVEAVRARGWAALPVAGSPAAIQNQLARGRPVIALTGRGTGSGHFIVIVAWANGGVIVHDPAVGPFRASPEPEFDAAWARTGHWALLVLPPPAGQPPLPGVIATDSRSTRMVDGCDGIVDAGIRQARAGDTGGAELRFQTAAALCPASAAPFRELAGLRFSAGDWVGAARMAERALVLEPGDSLTCRLLAGSLFLSGDIEGALGAWNLVGEPRSDLTRVDGLTRTRYRAVTDQLDFSPRQLITPGGFLRARRRLAEVPAQSGSCLSVRPRPGGVADVNVALLERPLLFNGPWEMGGAVLRSVAERRLALDLASPTGNGELLTTEYGWWTERPRLMLALAVPAATGQPGIWRVEGLWERQAYASRPSLAPGNTTGPGVVRERRHRTSLSFSDWVGPSLRMEASAAVDKWADRGTCLSVAGAFDARGARDRLGLRAELAGWAGPGGGVPFSAAGLLLRWRSGEYPHGAWQARAGVQSVSSMAPLALWPGAGTGPARAPLLRAHPLLDGGVLTGRAFGRTLVHAGIERQEWPWSVGPIRLGWAVFIDGARPWATLNSDRVPWQVDGGVGLRLGGAGRGGQLRVDVARGFVDGGTVLSVGWQAR